MAKIRLATFDAGPSIALASRARDSAGSRMLISNAMIPMTTKSSTRVKPSRLRRVADMIRSSFPYGVAPLPRGRGAI